MNVVVITGLTVSLVAAFFVAYGRIFRTKGTIHEESKTSGHVNLKEERHRFVETRMTQTGAALLVAGFAIQIIGNVFFES